MLVGEFIKVINAFIIVQDRCSRDEHVAWKLLCEISFAIFSLSEKKI
jgi:hypothetical protein